MYFHFMKNDVLFYLYSAEHVNGNIFTIMHLIAKLGQRLDPEAPLAKLKCKLCLHKTRALLKLIATIKFGAAELASKPKYIICCRWILVAPTVKRLFQLHETSTPKTVTVFTYHFGTQ